jgi:hypothetical protein
MYIHFHDYGPEKDLMFTILRPFFANNNKLEHLRICSLTTSWISEESINVLCARSTLKQLYYDGCNNPFESGLICKLIKTNKSLEKLSLGRGCFIDDDCSSVLESTLVNPDCRLKSVSLDDFFVELPWWRVNREMDVTGIARGLALNTSINHLKCTGRYSQVLLGDKPNDSLKALDIRVAEQFGYQLSNSLKRFVALKKLKVHANYVFDTIKSDVLSSIIKEVLTPSSKLEEFFIPEEVMNDENIKVLGECICLNKTLKTLSLCNSTKVTNAGWTLFLKQLARSGHSLESLDLTRCKLGDATRDLIAFIKVSPSLKTLKLFCINTTPGDFDALVAVLNKSNVERIEVHDPNGNFYQLIEGGRFTSVDLGYSSTLEEYNRIARAIESPNCRLEEICTSVVIASQREMLEVTTAWARVLGTNSTLKSIDIVCSFERSGCTSQFWQEYSPILGKCRSIEGTYNGNHTIETINIGLNYEDEHYEEYEEVFTMLPEVRSLLEFNRNDDKVAVARRKILFEHFSGKERVQKLHDLGLARGAVAHLVHWIGKEQSELPLMFDFVKSMPDLIEGAVQCAHSKKRKERA